MRLVGKSQVSRQGERLFREVYRRSEIVHCLRAALALEPEQPHRLELIDINRATRKMKKPSCLYFNLSQDTLQEDSWQVSERLQELT